MAMPPGQRPGAYGSPAQPPPPSGKRAWPVRHPVWTGLIAIAALLLVAVAAANGGGTGSTRTGSTSAAPPPSPSPRPSSTPTAHVAAVACQAQAVRRRPADHTIVQIRVRTAARAQVTVTGPLAPVRNESGTGRASAKGMRTLRFRVGDAPPGVAVVMTVRVSRGSGEGSCQARLRPRAARVTAVAAPATPPAPPASMAPPPPSVSCYPLSNEGTCYEPGEFCRDDDHGMTGLAGDGKTIVCEDNDGWRWEPV
jgi:hypothetical protein